MYLLIVILPWILYLCISFFGRQLGLRGTYLLSISVLLILLIMSLILFNEILLDSNFVNINVINLISSDILLINYNIIFDDLSISMLLVLSSITLLVLIYSYDYVINDPHLIRFFSYIILFICFMIILITSTSLPILFVGWEGIGLVSFLLISFWYTRIETNFGAILAVLMNRIGDIFFILGMLLSLLLLGSNDIILMISFLVINNIYLLDLLLISFILAAMAKSAQLYLHIWLIYSMEGPTPISALIHTASLVTAGIFLILRLSLLMYYSYYSLILVTIIGSLTCFIGGTLAIVSLDLKELIAYSTMSQLGYMFTILGLKYTNLSFFHLMFHAYFKALLFLTAGSIIHSILDIQDIRLTGSLRNFLPISYIVMLVGFISLTGLPFTTGFYSKEAIINSSFNNYTFLSNFIYIITLLTAFLTIFYSYKFLYYLFFKTSRNSLFTLQNIHYFSLHLTLSLTILSIITIFFGYFFHKLVYLYNLPIEFNNLNIPTIIKFIPIIFFITIPIFFIYFFNNYKSYNIHFLNHSFYFKLLYQTIAGSFITLAYRILFKIFDYGFIDLFFPLTSHQFYNFSHFINIWLNSNFYIPFILFNFYIIFFII